MKKKTVLFFLLFAVVVTAAFLSGGDLQSQQAVSHSTKKNDHLQSKTKESSVKAPNFTLKTLSGDTLSLKDFRGRYVLINMWASWCGPCKKEAPELVKIDQAYPDQKLMILGVNMTSQEMSIQNVKHFVQQKGITFPVLLDRDGKVMNEYHVIGIPTTYLIGPNGKVLHRFRGAITLKEIRKFVQPG